MDARDSAGDFFHGYDAGSDIAADYGYEPVSHLPRDSLELGILQGLSDIQTVNCSEPFPSLALMSPTRTGPHFPNRYNPILVWRYRHLPKAETTA